MGSRLQVSSCTISRAVELARAYTERRVEFTNLDEICGVHEEPCAYAACTSDTEGHWERYRFGWRCCGRHRYGTGCAQTLLRLRLHCVKEHATRVLRVSRWVRPRSLRCETTEGFARLPALLALTQRVYHALPIFMHSVAKLRNLPPDIKLHQSGTTHVNVHERSHASPVCRGLQQKRAKSLRCPNEMRFPLASHPVPAFVIRP